MIIGKRNLKIIKKFLVSGSVEKFTLVSYIVLMPLLTFYDEISIGASPVNVEQLNLNFAFD